MKLSEKQQQHMDDMETTLQQGYEALARELAAGHTEHFQRMLAQQAHFYKYSFGNLMLIWLQAQKQGFEPTFVQAAWKWKKQGRTFKTGSKGLWILKPCFKKVTDQKTGEEKQVFIGCVPGLVFAIEQVVPDEKKDAALKVVGFYDRPLPADDFAAYDLLKAACEADGYEVVTVDAPSTGAQGYINLDGSKQIFISKQAKAPHLTLIHEWAHQACQHSRERKDQTTYQSRELEAETARYIVGFALGLAVPWSTDYILDYGGDAAGIKAHFDTASPAAKHIIEAVMKQAGKRAEAEAEPEQEA